MTMNSIDKNSVALDLDPSKKGKERNDNSNPQQGTGGSRSVSASPDSTKQTCKEDAAPTPNLSSAKNIPYTRASLKIPPTKKDERKLFVGGLPANSKYLEGF